jgi:TPR repeat protein
MNALRALASLAVLLSVFVSLSLTFQLAQHTGPIAETQAERDVAAARRYFRSGQTDEAWRRLRQVERRHPHRYQLARGRLYRDGLLGDEAPAPEWEKAAEAFAQVADSAPPRLQAMAKMELAKIFERGDVRSDIEPETLLQEASNLGNMAARGRLGEAWLQADEPARREEALRLLHEASWHDVDAALTLVRHYRKGTTAPPTRRAVDDLTLRAHRLMTADAARRDIDAMLALADFLSSDLAIERRDALALEWYQEAGLRGSAIGNERALHFLLTPGTNTYDAEEGIELLADMARNGDMQAANALGGHYLAGAHQLQRDLVQAKRWFKLARDAGSVDALLGLADVEAAAPGGGEREQIEALLSDAAAAGSSRAAFRLAEAIEAEAARDRHAGKRAIAWYIQAADRGHRGAMVRLANHYLEGRLVESNLKAALGWTKEALNAGSTNTAMMLRLADAYTSGTSIAADPKEAFRWSLAAAEAGDLVGMIRVGKAYSTGDGTDVDPKEAFRWHRLAAGKGSIDATVRLGEAHASGFGTPLDPAMAFLQFKNAAAAGSVVAQRETARAYLLGFGVEPNRREALERFEDAAREGDVPAMIELVHMLRENADSEKNLAKAFDWLETAAALDDDEAQFLLGEAYLEGALVRADPALARKWLASAERLGSQAASRLLQSLGEDEGSGGVEVKSDA